MIVIKEQFKCCGCSACEQCCPKYCITLKADQQGFLYPETDSEECINCGLCEQVCPMLQLNCSREPLAANAVINPNESIRLKSSSGGVFTAIAEHVIKNGGVVFGARFNEQWEVVHDYTETVDGLAAFRGSKYVQSRIGNCYLKVEEFLKQDRYVLFTGTPCQVSGLKHFLRKEYDKLLAVDVACHGVPSPLVWKEYIENKQPKHISFRDKKLGWKKFSMRIDNYSNYHQKDCFMTCFLSNLSLRPSCFNCQFKAGASGCDLTLADFWGVTDIAPHLDDDKGISVVLSYSYKGKEFLKKINLTLIGVNSNKVYTHNSAILCSVKKPQDYNAFWQDFYKSGKRAIYKWGKKQMVSPIIIIKSFIYRFLH